MGLLDGLFDKEGMVETTIENSLERLSQELECKPTEIFLMIKPTKEIFSEDEKNFKCWLYKMEGSTPKAVREVTLKEILED